MFPTLILVRNRNKVRCGWRRRCTGDTRNDVPAKTASEVESERDEGIAHPSARFRKGIRTHLQKRLLSFVQTGNLAGKCKLPLADEPIKKVTLENHLLAAGLQS
jgi:hypothetical protein